MTRVTISDLQSQLGELTSAHEKLEERVTKMETNIEAIKNSLECLLGKSNTGGMEPTTRPTVPSSEADRPAPVVAVDNLLNKENSNYSHFDKVDPSHIKKFEGTPSKLVDWLISLKRWAIDLDLRGCDELFQGPKPPI